MNRQAAMLEATAITLGYGKIPVISDLSLVLHPGSLIGLIGPNGAGKTTLLLALSGQFRPASGTIRFDGMDIYLKNLAYKYRIGFVHENPYFYPYLTAAEFLAFIGRVKKNGRGKEFEELLEQVGLGPERHKLTADLSMGMKKKLAIAAAMVGNPEVLFLDEALNGIDVESAYAIKLMLQRYAEGGGTVILSTHVLEVIEKLCDRYLLLRSGRILADIEAASWKAAASGHHGGLEEYIITLLRK